MSEKRNWILLFVLLFSAPAYSQVRDIPAMCSCDVPVSIWKDSIMKGVNNIVNSVFRDSVKPNIYKPNPPAIQLPKIKTMNRTLSDHYLAYNATYTSRIEGEYNYDNLFQQTLNYSTTATMLNNLPFKLMLNARKTNSPWFRDYIDFSIGLSGNDLARRASQQSLEGQKASRLAQVNKLRTLYQSKIEQLRSLDIDLDNRIEDSCINAYIKSKEIIANMEHYEDSTNFPSGKKDSLLENAKSYVNWYDSTKNLINEFKERVNGLENDYKIVLQKFDKTISNATAGAIDAELPRILKEYGKGLADFDSTNPITDYSILQKIKRFSIGRSMPAGTQLNMQNISVKGLDLEYQTDRYFYTITTGWTDFGLRDFVYRSNNRRINNFVYAAGIGRGNRENNFVYVNVFGGDKNQDLAYSQRGQMSKSVIGLSLSSQFRINSWVLNGEVAQSSFEKPSNGVGKKSFSFSDKTNKAYSLTVNGYIREAGLYFSAFYKHYGANYYGFNAYRLNANIDLWGAEASKKILKNALSFKVSIKKNDYQNPLVQQVYSGKNIITTVNAVFNKKQFTVSAGYIPSYQYVGIRDTIFETRYEVINFLFSLRYKTGDVPTSTSLIFNRFLNSQSDSGYFYGSSTNVVLNQLFLFPVYSTSLNISVFNNSVYRYIICDGGIQYQVSKTVTLKGGFKINSLSAAVYEAKAGAYGGTTVNVPKVGLFTFRLDSQYYPDLNYHLYSSTMGSIGFSTHFK